MHVACQVSDMDAGSHMDMSVETYVFSQNKTANSHTHARLSKA